MSQLCSYELTKYIDISLVRTDVTYTEIELLANIAKKYKFICSFVMPCFTELLINKLCDSDVMVGGVVGFPSGADTTESKIEQAKQMKLLGCNEIDMVINVGALRSADYETVKNDISAVVNAVFPTPVKSILEIAYLTDEQIKVACRIAVESGVTFVKSGTGWANKPTTVETIRIMKNAVEGKAKIKAAGGVRTLTDVEAMIAVGCDRFGISLKSSLSILKEAYDREGKKFEDDDLLANFNALTSKY